MYVSARSSGAASTASGHPRPCAVIDTTPAPRSIACARARRANAVSVVWEMITTASSALSAGGSPQNAAEERQRASRFPGPNINAPSSAACWLVPVPTSQTRFERPIRSAASSTGTVRTDSSRSACAAIVSDSAVIGVIVAWTAPHVRPERGRIPLRAQILRRVGSPPRARAVGVYAAQKTPGSPQWRLPPGGVVPGVVPGPPEPPPAPPPPPPPPVLPPPSPAV